MRTGKTKTHWECNDSRRKIEEEKSNKGNSTNGDQCQIGSKCKDSNGETKVNYPIIIIFPPTGFINQS